jgi:hypothetical protein
MIRSSFPVGSPAVRGADETCPFTADDLVEVLVRGHMNRHSPDDRLGELKFLPRDGIGKLGSSPPGLPCTIPGDAGAFCGRNVDSVFIKTHFSSGFRRDA